MSTQYSPRGSRPRYLGNSNTMQVHDLDNTKPSCQVSEIKSEHRVPFATLSEAKRAGYDPCAYCIGD